MSQFPAHALLTVHTVPSAQSTRGLCSWQPGTRSPSPLAAPSALCSASIEGSETDRDGNS